jgi:hypothetical protein
MPNTVRSGGGAARVSLHESGRPIVRRCRKKHAIMRQMSVRDPCLRSQTMAARLCSSRAVPGLTSRRCSARRCRAAFLMRRRGSSSAPFGFQSPAAGPTLLLGSLGQADDRHLALARQPALEERACAGDLGPERVAHAAVRRLDRDWRRGRDEEGKLEAIDAALELDEAAAG